MFEDASSSSAPAPGVLLTSDEQSAPSASASLSDSYVRTMTRSENDTRHNNLPRTPAAEEEVEGRAPAEVVEGRVARFKMDDERLVLRLVERMRSGDDCALAL